MTFGNVLKQSIINTVNHKTIAGLGGSVLSIIIRFKLSSPGGYLFFDSGQVYNSVLTIHGIAFPQVNVLSFWFTFVVFFCFFGCDNFGFTYFTTQNMLSVAETSFLLVLSVPLLAGPLLFLLFDRNFNTSFYDTKNEVYVIILPVFGIINEAVFITFTSIWIAVLGTSVWGHHVYTTGLDIDTRVANFNIANFVGLYGCFC
uniref:Cytochrome c oxidase subunit 1 n=1 Tax=Wuchereria bancrofti TaxID=6293 RepID=A0AAF5Q6Z2_WUCBA